MCTLKATVEAAFKESGLMEKWEKSRVQAQKCRQVHLLSMEALPGRQTISILINLGIYEQVKEALLEKGLDIDTMEEEEIDAALGSGGLGRLVNCFIESSATMNLPVTLHTLRYREGLFKQKIVDGKQTEEPEPWEETDYWSVCRKNEAVKIVFPDGGSVDAVPYDMPVPGYGTTYINTTRTWKAENPSGTNKELLAQLTNRLYPHDDTDEGKELRLKQEYFLVNAALYSATNRYSPGEMSEFCKKEVFQLNDTHGAMAILEFMAHLMDREKLPFHTAWEMSKSVFSYTCHTIMQEAMESWSSELFQRLFPRYWEIIQQIDNRVTAAKPIIEGKSVNMANLSIIGSRFVNGVAEIHTEIMKSRVFKEFYDAEPEKFLNITNGITQRRWLVQANPELARLITNTLQDSRWVREPLMLKELEAYGNDIQFLEKLLYVKRRNKERLREYILQNGGPSLNTEHMFCMQIKRWHEYKRQLLTGFCILDRYFRHKAKVDKTLVPMTFIFSGKAHSSYKRAKYIIEYLLQIADLVNNDPDTKDKLQVVFIENYNVSWAQKIIPAADLSLQTPAVGTEASATGNMKQMMNGAPTCGTYDGANINITRAAGCENNFIFGARVEEVNLLREIGYNPVEYYVVKPWLAKVINTLTDGTFGVNEGFAELRDSLLTDKFWHSPDCYFLCRDFADYCDALDKAGRAFTNPQRWARMCLANIANSGQFSSDISMEKYAKNIWQIEPITI